MALTEQKLQQLRLRRFIAQQAQKRLRKRKKVPPITYPRAARIEYLQELRAVVRDLRALVETRWLPALERMLPDNAVLRQDAADDFEGRLFDTGAVVDEVAPAERRKTIARKTTKRVADHNKAQVNKQFEASLGISLLHDEPELQQQLDLAAVDNARLVKKFTTEQVEGLRDVVMDGVRTGKRIELIKREIEARFDVSEKRAALLARDQVGKLNGQLTELRHESVGIDEYEWSTSRDERVRHDHAALEGTTHKWSDPPIVNQRTGARAHPGGDYNCRCSAIPRTDKLLEALAA